MDGVVLLIFDGWGEAPSWGGNAIAMAKKPNFDQLAKSGARTKLLASGQAVGLPGNEMGNSEVGHLNIGAGRIPKLDSSMIFEAIADGSFFTNETILAAVRYAKNHGGNIHLMGLVSDGGVHAHLEHLLALLKLLKQERADRVYIHAFTDGRDTPPTSAIIYLSRLQDKIKQLGIGTIASVTGRFFAMDRDRHWDRTKQVVDALVAGQGVKTRSALQVVAAAYREGITDEFIPPSLVWAGERPLVQIRPSDAVIFFNFRSDRARQISQMLVEAVPNIFFIGFIPYGFEKEAPPGLHSAFAPKVIGNCLTEVIAKHGFKQLHIAETEKYAHVTYFLNGGRERPFAGENRLLIPSDSHVSFDKKPEMEAPVIARKLSEAIATRAYRFLVANFANLDMVGHTGNFNAVIRAVETVDGLLGQLVKSCSQSRYHLVMTGDHGNAEEMINPVTGEMNTEHSRNPVPFIISQVGADRGRTLPEGVLADVAPTVLQLLSINVPEEMTGKPLL